MIDLFGFLAFIALAIGVTSLGYIALNFGAIRPIIRAWRDDRAAPALSLLYLQTCILYIALDGFRSPISVIASLGYAPLLFLSDPINYGIFLHDFHAHVLWLTALTWILPTIGLLFLRKHVSAMLLLLALPILTSAVVNHSIETHFAELIPAKARELGATCLWQQSVRESHLDAADGFQDDYHAVAQLPSGDWMAWSYKGNDFYLVEEKRYRSVNPNAYRDACKPLD